MTGDELAAAICAEQGFNVMNFDAPLKAGDILKCGGKYHMQTPLRILGPATREEFDRQHELSVRITGDNPDVSHWIPKRYFYRVEAAD